MEKTLILEEDRFTAHVDLSAQAVARNPSRVLLAIEAHAPEVEYGYVVPWADGGEINLHGTRRVVRVVEKPGIPMAQDLFDSGALWNTMIMVFRVKTLLQIIEDLCPNVYGQFFPVLDVIGTADEQETIEEVYRTVDPLNFSKGILEKISQVYPEIISVLPVLQVYWTDWGLSPTGVGESATIETASATLRCSPIAGSAPRERTDSDIRSCTGMVTQVHVTTKLKIRREGERSHMSWPIVKYREWQTIVTALFVGITILTAPTRSRQNRSRHSYLSYIDYGNPRRREPPLYLYTAASTTQGFRRTLGNLGNGRRIRPSHSTDKVTPFTTTVTLVAKITVPRYVESNNDLGCAPEFPHGRELRLPECCVPVYAAPWRAADHP